MANIKFYTLEDLMVMFKVTKRTLYNYIKDGKLKANKVANKWIVTEEQLKDFIDGK
jgi:predicted site-specific integrase-resolvase